MARQADARPFMTESQSVETWLRDNFQDFKTEKIEKTRHMDQLNATKYCSEDDISQEENSPLPREKQLGNNSIGKNHFTIFQTQEIKNK